MAGQRRAPPRRNTGGAGARRRSTFGAASRCITRGRHALKGRKFGPQDLRRGFATYRVRVSTKMGGGADATHTRQCLEPTQAPPRRNHAMKRRRAPAAWATGTGDRSDRAPDEVVQRAKEAFRSRAALPLATAVADSALPDSPGHRRLRFENASLAVDVAVEAFADRCNVRGVVVPPQLEVALEMEGARDTPAEGRNDGNFAFAGIPRGVLRLRVLARDGSALAVTEWFLV